MPELIPSSPSTLGFFGWLVVVFWVGWVGGEGSRLHRGRQRREESPPPCHKQLRGGGEGNILYTRAAQQLIHLSFFHRG